jgi:hypothetical protein
MYAPINPALTNLSPLNALNFKTPKESLFFTSLGDINVPLLVSNRIEGWTENSPVVSP